MGRTEVPEIRWVTEPDQGVQITNSRGDLIYEGPGPVPEGLLVNGETYYFGRWDVPPVSVSYQWPADELAELLTSSRRNRRTRPPRSGRRGKRQP